MIPYSFTKKVEGSICFGGNTSLSITRSYCKVIKLVFIIISSKG